MTKYRHCDISHASLDNKECAIFVLMEKRKQLFGAPLFGIFDETSGVFSISNEQIKMSYELVKPEIYKEEHLYDEWEKREELDEYTFEHHRSALCRANGGNNSFKTFVVLKSVYEKVSLGNDIPFFNSCEIELEENLIRIAETESLFYSMVKILDEKNKAVFMEQNPSKKMFDDNNSSKIFEAFIKEKNKENACNIIDFMRKHQTIRMHITEVIDQPSINDYLNHLDIEINNISKLYIQSLKFRTVIGTIQPLVDNNINSNHQGRDTDYYIQFYKTIIQGLEDSKS